MEKLDLSRSSEKHTYRVSSVWGDDLTGVEPDIGKCESRDLNPQHACKTWCGGLRL